MDESNREMNKESPPRKSAGSTESMKSNIYEWISSIIFALVMCVLAFTFVVRIVSVDGESMVPTLQNGDRLMVSSLFYTPERGDIVIIRKASFSDRAIVKRIIALEGQTVDIDFNSGIVYVDDVAQAEDYTASLTYLKENFTEKITVPEGCVFVMGDNRNNSLDSRDERIGCVDTRYILGKAYLVLFPGTESNGKREMSRIGSLY